MKKTLLIGLFISAIMLILPMSVLGNSQKNAVIQLQEHIPTVSNLPKQSTSFKVLNFQSKEITEISSTDYIFGVVAAEMPALYEKEALKAQAVAAYTFALCRKNENIDKEYDITTDSFTDQGFITKEEAAQRWGENTEEYTKKIKDAINEVSGYAITYENQPIIAVYHALSSGKTESSKDVWGIELEYLTPVASESDKLAANFETEVSFTLEELKEKLKDTVELTGEPEKIFSDCKRTDSGAVISINICDKEIRGADLRSLLDLRSSDFSVDYKEQKFIFTVRGYGHGVGMSQNGANNMAKLGSEFDEILTYYYKGSRVEKLK